MRTISLVKRLKWNFSGNMNPHALVIGDVDNDNVTLAAFPYKCSKLTVFTVGK